MTRFPDIESVWTFLGGIPMFANTGTKAANFDLGNIRRFCEAIGNPQNQFKSIHIAGTNGKGTTAHLLEAVYGQAGYKTGVFTSPHLVRYNERVRIGGKEIPDEAIVGFFREVESIIDEIPLTYFEWSTALAFWAFAREKVDVAIVECGLGGRLDSTNILTPELSIVTSVGLDHEAILGNTITKIAREKAGIIKTGKPVVLGYLSDEALIAITEHCSEVGAEMYQAERLKPVWKDGEVVLSAVNFSVKTTFREPVNRWNVAMVFEVVDVLAATFPIKISAFKAALESFPGVPARFEKLVADRDWYFSGSHNSQAISAMLEGLESLKQNDPVLVLSLMKDKAKPEILERFQPFSRKYYYQQSGERAAAFEEISRFLSVQKIEESTAQTILNELASSVVIFAGSFYFYSIVQRWLNQ